MIVNQRTAFIRIRSWFIIPSLHLSEPACLLTLLRGCVIYLFLLGTDFKGITEPIVPNFDRVIINGLRPWSRVCTDGMTLIPEVEKVLFIILEFERVHTTNEAIDVLLAVWIRDDIDVIYKWGHCDAIINFLLSQAV